MLIDVFSSLCLGLNIGTNTLVYCEFVAQQAYRAWRGVQAEIRNFGELMTLNEVGPLR